MDNGWWTTDWYWHALHSWLLRWASKKAKAKFFLSRIGALAQIDDHAMWIYVHGVPKSEGTFLTANISEMISVNLFMHLFTYFFFICSCFGDIIATFIYCCNFFKIFNWWFCIINENESTDLFRAKCCWRDHTNHSAHFNPLIATLKPQSSGSSYSNTVIDTLAVDGGLLQSIQRGGDWVGPQPAQAPPRCINCNRPPINGQWTNFVLFDVPLQLPSESKGFVTTAITIFP